MGRTITAYLLTSQDIFMSGSGATNPNALPITNTSGTVITLNNNEFPVKVVITGQMQRMASISYWDDLYIGNSSRGNGYRIIHLWLTGGSDGVTSLTSSSTFQDGSTNYTWQTFTGTNLKGKALYLYDTNAGYAAYHNNRWTVQIYTHYTINAPTNVKLNNSTSNINSGGYVTLSWTAGAINNGTLNAYGIQYQDRANSSGTWGSWTDYSSTTSTSMSVRIHANNGGQRRYRVRAIATNEVYSSGYTTSPICTSVRPTVSAGTVITKAQWDNLKNWRGSAKGITGITSATQGNKITATIANTYRASSATAGNTIPASWYNSD